MTRASMLARLAHRTDPWDVVVVGGGATGLGVAVDSAARGYSTLLLEQHDFAKGTSSRSTKLIHGGVRYLRQGNVALVLEALHERGRLRKNAPHLVRDLPFVVPAYDWWEGPFYGVGLRIYDMLAGKLGLGPSRNLSRKETLERIPTIEPDGLRGGVEYHDAQFDDARLALSLARTAVDLGATVINYMRVTSFTRDRNLINGVVALDEESGTNHVIRARVVVNATGVFSDYVREIADPNRRPMIRASQGVHIVLDGTFLRGTTAIMVPSTDDGRVLFAIPWYGRTLIGTTDTPVPRTSIEPKPLKEEVEFLLEHAARYLTRDPEPSDVLSAFAGLRPLVSPADSDDSADTAEVSREHVVHISGSGLVTIAGGKWTTYRKMAEDTVDQAAVVGGLSQRDSQTASMRLHGYTDATSSTDIDVYGSDRPEMEAVVAENPAYSEPISPGLPYVKGEIVYAVRNEMARTVDDVLSRRTRSLMLDARAARDAAGETARLMAGELGQSAEWVAREARMFERLAERYIVRDPR